MTGGVPEERRTGGLSAAFNNVAEHEELANNYRALCAYYRGIHATAQPRLR